MAILLESCLQKNRSQAESGRVCPQKNVSQAQHGSLWAGGLQPLRGVVQAPTRNPLLARPPAPVGLCLYLVTLGGFASSTGIWHLRWKISLVRSPWKQAEPLRRFTLNGVRPACIRCPVYLEFPPRLFEPLSRPDASFPRRPQAFALEADSGSLEMGLPGTQGP